MAVPLAASRLSWRHSNRIPTDTLTQPSLSVSPFTVFCPLGRHASTGLQSVFKTDNTDVVQSLSRGSGEQRTHSTVSLWMTCSELAGKYEQVIDRRVPSKCDRSVLASRRPAMHPFCVATTAHLQRQGRRTHTYTHSPPTKGKEDRKKRPFGSWFSETSVLGQVPGPVGSYQPFYLGTYVILFRLHVKHDKLLSLVLPFVSLQRSPFSLIVEKQMFGSFLWVHWGGGWLSIRQPMSGGG